MLYIVSEDSGAGYQFWMEIARVLSKHEQQCKVIPADGYPDVMDKYLSLVRDKLGVTICTNDFIFLAVDCLEFSHSEVSSPNMLAMQSELTKVASTVKCKVYYPTYYCFEEILLSFSDIFSLVGKQAHDLSFVIQELQEQLRSDRFSWTPSSTSLHGVPSKYLQGEYKYVDGEMINTPLNREQFMYELLHDFTMLADGRRVTVDKSSIGDCWLKSCSRLTATKGRHGGIPHCKCEGCGMDSEYLCMEKVMYVAVNSELYSEAKNSFAQLIRDIQEQSQAEKTALFI